MDASKQKHEKSVLRQRLRRAVGRAIEDYGMISPGDRVMVCLSGGKDSHGLLDILLKLRQAAPFEFGVFAVLMDQGHPGFDSSAVESHVAAQGVRCLVIRQDTYSVVRRVIPAGKTACGLCSRMRRGLLYRVADEEGATKIALGHHADDIVETLFLNLFHGGALKAMPPRLTTRDGRHTVIRPLAYCRERDLAAHAAERRFPIIPCNLCGATEDGARRKVKAMLRQWEREHPGRLNSVFSAIGNVAPSHLMDRRLFDFFRPPAPALAAQGEECHAII